MSLLDVDPEEWAQWEAEQLATIAEDDRCRREAQQRAAIANIPVLVDRVLDLEARVFLTGEFFAGMVTMHEETVGVVAEFVELWPAARWFFVARGVDV